MQTQLDTEAQLIQEISNNPGVIRTYLEGMVPSLLSFLVQLIVAILVLLIGSRIIKFLLKLLRKSLDRSRVETGVVTFLCSCRNMPKCVQENCQIVCYVQYV